MDCVALISGSRASSITSFASPWSRRQPKFHHQPTQEATEAVTPKASASRANLFDKCEFAKDFGYKSPW